MLFKFIIFFVDTVFIRLFRCSCIDIKYVLPHKSLYQSKNHKSVAYFDKIPITISETSQTFE